MIGRAATAGVLATLALGLGGCAGGSSRDPGADGRTPGASAGGSNRVTTRVELVERLSKERFNPEAIYRTEGPGVVTVISIFGGEAPAPNASGAGGSQGDGLGSGFVLDGDGEIATNAHVVLEGDGAKATRATQVFVEFADGNQVPAKIVGTDLNADIALLRIDPTGLTLRPLPLASGQAIRVGSPVAALGSPFGERQSLSVGVVSATDRSIASLTNFQIPGAVQTDAAINPGNSGGPLLNAAGEVIGVNQQIQTSSGGGEGVGFAVPVDVVRRSLAQLRAYGKAEYAYLGVASVSLYPQLKRAFGLPVQTGAWLQEISGDGPAEGADLRGGKGERSFQARRYATGGDIVVGVGDARVRNPADLASAISRHAPGDTVVLHLYRNGARRDVEVKLGARPTAGPRGG